jgi:hypothetical protein
MLLGTGDRRWAMLTRLRCLLLMHHWRTEPTDAGGHQLSCADCGKLKRSSVDDAKIREHRRGPHGGYGSSNYADPGGGDL